MKQGKKSFRHESLQDAKSIQALLKSITRGFARGELSFSDDDDEMVMYPRGLMDFKLSSSQEENRHKLNIRISWQVEEEKKKEKKLLTVK